MCALPRYTPCVCCESRVCVCESVSEHNTCERLWFRLFNFMSAGSGNMPTKLHVAAASGRREKRSRSTQINTLARRTAAHIECVHTFDIYKTRLPHERDPFDTSLSLICINHTNLWIYRLMRVCVCARALHTLTHPPWTCFLTKITTFNSELWCVQR